MSIQELDLEVAGEEMGEVAAHAYFTKPARKGADSFIRCYPSPKCGAVSAVGTVGGAKLNHNPIVGLNGVCSVQLKREVAQNTLLSVTYIASPARPPGALYASQEHFPKEESMATAAPAVKTNRVWYAAIAMFTQVILGVLYTWSVFRGPLASLHGWTDAETVAPYRYSLLALAIGTVIAGIWQDRKGPRVVETISGILLGSGMLLAAFFSDSVPGLIFSYGILGGLGVGFGYVAPIATCIKWFPDKRGFIAGLAVVGSGIGPVFYGPLLQSLIGNDPAKYAESIPRTFLILAVLFYITVIGAGQFYRVPPPGWKPEGWTPPPASQRSSADYSMAGMARTWQFGVLYVLYFLGASVGLTAIGMAAPLLAFAGGATAVLSIGVAVGLVSFFNGGGRLSWGALSDRLGRKAAAMMTATVSIVTCLVFLRPASGFWPVIAGLALAAFSYGGWLAIMPSLTADYYGQKNIGSNYGLLFSAWGLCGFFVPGYFATIMDRHRAAGDVPGGYAEVYTGLAILSAAALALAAVLQKPKTRA